MDNDGFGEFFKNLSGTRIKSHCWGLGLLFPFCFPLWSSQDIWPKSAENWCAGGSTPQLSKVRLMKAVNRELITLLGKRLSEDKKEWFP